MRQRNPLVFGDETEFNNLPPETRIFWLIESVTVCNQSYADRVALEKSPTKEMLKKFTKDSKAWRKERERAQAAYLKQVDADLTGWWASEIAQFRNYLNSSRIITDFKFKREPFPFLPCGPMPDADKGRSRGGPYESTLIQFLLTAHFVKDQAEAMEYPFALAEMHYLTHLEREGAIKILNTEEIEFKETCEARDLAAAKTAGFKTVEEHIEFIKGNARQEQTKKAEQAKSGGMASEIPVELKGTP